MDFQRGETIYSELARRYKSVSGRDNHAMSPVASAPSAPDVFSLQNLKPAQRPQLALSKTSKAVRTKKFSVCFEGQGKIH